MNLKGGAQHHTQQKATSLRALGRHKPLIPVVTFLAPRRHGTDGTDSTARTARPGRPGRHHTAAHMLQPVGAARRGRVNPRALNPVTPTNF